MTWLAFVLRVAPLLIGAIKGAEVKFPARGQGETKKADVLATVWPTVAETLEVETHEDSRHEELRKAVAWTVDAAVAWMKVLGQM